MISCAKNPYAWGKGLLFFFSINEPLDYRMMHQFILQKAGEFGDEKVLQKALELFWNGTSTHPDVKTLVYKWVLIAFIAERVVDVAEFVTQTIYQMK